MTLQQLRELMATGSMYNDLSPELVEARKRAVVLTNLYTQSFCQSAAEREAILRELLGKAGQGVYFEPNLRCEFGFNVSIGDRFYANFDCVLLDGARIDIGDNVLFDRGWASIQRTTHWMLQRERLVGATRSPSESGAGCGLVAASR